MTILHFALPSLRPMRYLPALLIALICPVSSRAPDTSDDGYRALREEMVTRQIQARGIKDSSVLAAMRNVKRHLFVPPALHSQAYNDHPLPIGEGQTISQPYIVALMTETIAPHRAMKVLEIGTGSGYQAAVLAELCDTVYTIEIFESLAQSAGRALVEAGYRSVKIRTGDGYQGWPEHAPFDAIIVTCAPTHVPPALIAQLRDGGKIVIPVGQSGAQELVVLTKKGDSMVRQAIIPVRFVPMIDGAGKRY